MAISKVFTADEYVESLLYDVYNLPTTYSNRVDQTTKTYYNCGYRGMQSYMFDCWNWGKVKAWGWKPGYNVGSFLYAPGTNGVDDWNGQQIMDRCADVSTNFKSIVPAETLLTPAADHVGTFIGKHLWNGYEFNVAECTPKIVRDGKLVMSAGCHLSYVDEQGRRFNHKGGVQVGTWAKHGKTPWVDFSNKDLPLNYTIKYDKNKMTIDVTEGKGTITITTNVK